MNHGQNGRIAAHLRALAERVEKSPHEYAAKFSAYGGEPRFIDRGGRRIPDGFGPICMTVILGDEDFVEVREVTAFVPGDRNKGDQC